MAAFKGESGSKWLPILLVLLVLAAAVGGYFAYQNMNDSDTTVETSGF